MIHLYGIANCDTVKKARQWLTENGVDFTFVDFKKMPPNAEIISEWLTQLPLESLLNKRGTTWRKLDTQTQMLASETDTAITVMVENPSVIKRPILDIDGKYYVGFSVENYQQVFGK